MGDTMKIIALLLALAIPVLAHAQASVTADDQSYLGGVAIGAGNSPQGPGTEIVGNGGIAIPSLWLNGLVESLGSAPTCGTGCASIAANSTNTRGTAVGGSAVTSIVVNWSGTLPSVPFCVISESATGALAGASTSATALTITLASSLSADSVTWFCVQ